MNLYRRGFWLAVSAAIVLAGGWGWSWWTARTHAQGQRPAASATAPSAPVVSAPDTESAPAPALAPLHITPQRLETIGVETGVVRRAPVEDRISAVGDVAVDERSLAYVQLRFSGWIQHVFVNATDQYVRRGEPLLTIYSPELVTTEEEYLIARRNARALATSSVPGVSAGAASLLRDAAARLEQWQVPQGEIEHLERSGQVTQALEIDAPASGYVIERNALPNMYAEPQTRLYTLASFAKVWVYAHVYQNQIAGIRPGEAAEITVDSYPGQLFRGRVDFVYPEIDPQTRTAKVRLELANPELLLKPGMYVNVVLERPLGRQILIPTSGALQTGTRSIVFVAHGGGYLEPRTVKLGQQVGDDYIVLGGLRPGEKIVTAANFLLDSESELQAALGSFAPPSPSVPTLGAGGEQAELAFTTAPSPPRLGRDIFVARLTGPKGAIAGAQVTATLSMAAMPQMGMPAMRVVVPLADQGSGRYQGEATLPSAGTWQVEVVARRAGLEIAEQHLSLTVGGGGA
ncbi:MAG TPA: efflux RND transporter periplasmic adaptor subunit [Terriglobales bacterium]|nr:efflux RND transporter periplasmic adaptor subunit [Terriglobales bacterium]